MLPVQFPLHEPYFDLTPIKITHTKVTHNENTTFYVKWIEHATKLIAHIPFSAWRVVSTHLRLYSPWHADSRLLVIPYSCSRVTDYNSRIVMSSFGD